MGSSRIPYPIRYPISLYKSPKFLATREDCEGYCGVGGCPNGGTPERNEFGQLIVCSSANSCPSTHECTSVTSGASVVNRCCPTRGNDMRIHSFGGGGSNFVKILTKFLFLGNFNFLKIFKIIKMDFWNTFHSQT